MKRFRKENIPIRGLNILLLIVICLIFFFTRSCNKDWDKLSGDKITVGVATIYNCVKGKGLQYHYVYKVDGEYYFGKVSSVASRYYIEDNVSLQSFLIVYRSDDPGLNVLIYQKPLPLTFNLDTIVLQKNGLRKFIKRNVLDNNDSNDASVRDMEEWGIYKKRVRKWNQ